MTAAVFAEILVIGIQVVALIALVALALVDSASLAAGFAVVKDGVALLTVPALAVAYTLGVLVDRLADGLTKDWDDRWRREALCSRQLPASLRVPELRHAILARNEAVMTPLEYSLSRLRIARATMVTAPLLTLATGWLARGGPVAQWGSVLIIGSLISLASICAWKDLARSYYRRVAEAYKEVTGSMPQAGLWGRVSVRKLPRQVAAVCYRRTESGIDFLLVKTSSGKRWTFPKGHLQADKSEVDSAQDEAREEAGVSGHILEEPLTTFVYANTDPAQELAVRAYLLEVRDQQPAAEHWREPTWCRRKKAKAKLAENRAAEYAEELARVIELAYEKVEP